MAQASGQSKRTDESAVAPIADVDAMMRDVYEALRRNLAAVESEIDRLVGQREQLVSRLDNVAGALGLENPARPAAARNGGGVDDALPSADAVASLSRREREVFDRLGRGESTREIAKSLGVNQTTVETYVRRIRSKLDLPSANKLKYLATVWATVRG